VGYDAAPPSGGAAPTPLLPMIRLLRKPKRVQAQSRTVHAVVRRFIPHLPVSKCTGTSKPCQSHTPAPSPPSHPTGFLMAACLNPNMATYCSQKGRGGGGYHITVCAGGGGDPKGTGSLGGAAPAPAAPRSIYWLHRPPATNALNLNPRCRVMAMVCGARPYFLLHNCSDDPPPPPLARTSSLLPTTRTSTATT
jgi:hypothetical protein